MEFKALASKRESCRKYTEQVVSKEDIIELIKVMQTSPSACNAQPYKCVVCQEDKAKKMHSCINNPLLPINRFTKDVNTFIIVCETKANLLKGILIHSQHYAQLDIGIAVATLCYAATDLGISTCIIGSFNEEKVQALFNIPKENSVRLIVAMGYAQASELKNKVRKDINQVVSFDSW